MKQLLLFILLTFPLGNFATSPAESSSSKDECRALYNELGCDMDYAAFERAWHGYMRIDHDKELMTVIDFTKPSTRERLFIIDMVRREVILSSHVAHGQGSGENYATSFGNEEGSHKSSLGFYLTGETYYGQKGYSMRLYGLETGINDRAYERAVVVHGAPYANPEVCAQGRLGRSWGCPALPEALTAKVIDLIKGGSLLFIYAEDSGYLTRSKFV